MQNMDCITPATRISKFSAILCIIIGCIVLVSWFFVSNSVIPSILIRTKVNTGIGILLSGLTLWLLNEKQNMHKYAYFLACIIFLLGFLTLCEVAFNLDLKIDQLIFKDSAVINVLHSPGRMSPYSALNFILISLCVWTFKSKKMVVFTQICISFILLTAFLYGIGYLFDERFFLNQRIVAPITPLASVAFILLSTSLFFLQADAGVIKFLSKPLYGSKMARRLLPLLVLIPILMGLIRLWGQKAGLYNTEYGTTLYTVITIVIFVMIVSLLAIIINRSEKAKENLMQDISESYAYTRTVLENIDECIITINDESKIESINAKGLSIFGYKLEEVLHQPLTMLMPEKFRSRHLVGIKRYQETGINHVINKGRIELQGLRKNGAIFPLELSVTQSWANNKRIFTGIVRDITEKKQIDLYQKQLTAIVESSSDAIISKTLDGMITSWNPGAEQLYGYSAAEVLNQSIFTIVPDEKKDEIKNILIKLKEGQNVPYFETERRHKDGHLIQVGIAISAIKDTDGKTIGASVIASDITERKKIDRLKNEFVSLVSHELRTPLTSIQGSLSLLVGGIAGELPDKAQKLLNIAKQNSERLIRLINDLLDIEKIESGKIEFKLEKLNIKKVVKEAIKVNQSYAEKFRMNIVLNREDDAYVLIDKDRILQVLANLLSNAIKFSAGNIVKVDIQKTANDVRVSVTNEGAGIPKDFQKRIFQKFAQADSTSTRAVAGTGLGLSISKEIVEKLNGQIGFISEPNKETTFYFDLPAVDDVKQPQIKSYEKIPNILICEDDVDIANYLKLVLEEYKFNILTCQTANEAKTILQKNTVDALLLDLILPDQNGISLIKELRQQYSISMLPIIVISVHAQKGKKELNGNAFPVLDWIDKPIDIDHLMKAIHTMQLAIKNRTPHILHIEDDTDLLEIIADALRDKVTVDGVSTLEQAKIELQHKKYDLVILDLMLPDGSGLDLLPIISKTHTPIIVYSANELPKENLQDVAQSLLKTQISIQDFVQTIKSTINKKPSESQTERSEL